MSSKAVREQVEEYIRANGPCTSRQISRDTGIPAGEMQAVIAFLSGRRITKAGYDNSQKGSPNLWKVIR